MQNAQRVADPMSGPSGHGPSAHVLGIEAAGVLTARRRHVRRSRSPTLARLRSGAHRLRLHADACSPDRRVALMTFVVKGMSEVYDPRGGFPIPLRDGSSRRIMRAPTPAPTPKIPAAGSEIARVTEVARQLVASPDLRGLTPRQRSQIVNWRCRRRATPCRRSPSSRKPRRRLQDAMTRGDVTSEDIVREYLARLSRLDRHGPTLRAMLALNPRAIAEARALDAERAAGSVRGPFHGIPVIFKDNIDVLGLPTTGGSRALRRSSAAARFARRGRHAAGRRGRARQSEPRRVPVRRFRHQHRRRHDRQRLRPVAEHRGLERRQRDGRREQPRDARLRHRHLQLAVEPGGVRVAGDDPRRRAA